MQGTLVTLSVTLLLSLMGAVWQISALASKLTETIRQHKEDIYDLRRGLERLERIPILESKLEQLEEFVSKTNSMLPKIEGRLQVAESKLISLREYRAPMRSWSGEDK